MAEGILIDSILLPTVLSHIIVIPHSIFYEILIKMCTIILPSEEFKDADNG